MKHEFITKIVYTLVSLAALFGLWEFPYKGWVEWILYSKYTLEVNENEIKRIRGKFHFWGGIVFIILCVMLVIFLIKPDTNIIRCDDPSTETESESSTTTPTTSTEIIDGTSPYYIENMSCEGATYTGYINEESREPNGEGRMVYNNGDIYDGEWVEGIQEGEGVFQYNNGDTYEGLWKNGKKDGSGVYIWSDGKKYDGEYREDKRDGEGVYTGWTGYISTYGWTGNYYGFHKDNAFEGYGRFEFDNGDKFVGIFNANQFWNGVYTNADGVEYKISNGKGVE